MAYYTESDPRFAPRTVVVGDAEQVVSQQAPHERVWQELARQQGISPVVIAGTGNAQEYVPNPQYEAWKASQKAQGIDVGMQDIPGTNYSKEAVILQNGSPVGEPFTVKTGSTFGEGLMELAPIALAAIGGQFLGAGGTASAAGQQAALMSGNVLGGTTAAGLGAAGAGAAGAAGIAEGMAPGVLAPATAAEMAGVNAVLGAGAAGAGAAGMAGTAGTAGTGAAAAGGAGMSAGTGAAAGAAQTPAFGLGNLLTAGSSLASGLLQSSAAQEAAATQAGAAQAGIAEQRRQFDEIQKLLAPYVQAGQGAIGGFQPYQQAGAQAFEQQQALAGLRGPEAQQAAISQIESSPFLQSQIEQGERALLQRASATGGLRGGNIQAALAQFRPQMLQQAIEQQYGRLGGFAGTGLGVTEQLYRGGQASATGQASQAQATGANIANLLQQQGAAQAGGQLSAAAPFANLLNMPMQLAGINYARTGQFGLPDFGGLFGGGSAPTGTAPTGGSGLRGP